MAISLMHIAALAALASLCIQTTCAAPLSAQRITRQAENSGTSEVVEPAAIKDLLSGLGVLEIVARNKLANALQLPIATVVDDSNATPRLDLSLNITCKYHQQNSTLGEMLLEPAFTNDSDIIAVQHLTEATLNDSCQWVQTTLLGHGSPYAVQCTDGELTSICGDWRILEMVSTIQDRFSTYISAIAHLTGENTAPDENGWVQENISTDFPQEVLDTVFELFPGCSYDGSRVDCNN